MRYLGTIKAVLKNIFQLLLRESRGRSDTEGNLRTENRGSCQDSFFNCRKRLKFDLGFNSSSQMYATKFKQRIISSPVTSAVIFIRKRALEVALCLSVDFPMEGNTFR